MHSFPHSDATCIYFFIFLRSSSRRNTILLRSASTWAWFIGGTPNLYSAASSEIQPILERKANCLHDLWTLSINRSFWYTSRSVGFVQCLLARWWRPRFQYKMGSDLVGNKWDASGECPPRFVRKQITSFWTTSEKCQRGVESGRELFNGRRTESVLEEILVVLTRGSFWSTDTIILFYFKSADTDWRKKALQIWQPERRKSFRSERQKIEWTFPQRNVHRTVVCWNHLSVSGCKYDDKLKFLRTEAFGQPSKKHTKGGAKRIIGGFTERDYSVGLCVHDSPQRKSNLWENDTKGSNLTVKFSKTTMRREKIWTRRVLRSESFKSASLRSEIHGLPNSRKERKKCARRDAWELAADGTKLRDVSWSTLELPCKCYVRRTWGLKSWRLSRGQDRPWQWWQPTDRSDEWRSASVCAWSSYFRHCTDASGNSCRTLANFAKRTITLRVAQW